MSLVKIKPIERSYGDFIISFRYIPKIGGTITIRDKNNRIDSTTFQLLGGKLMIEPDGEDFNGERMANFLTEKAAEKGYSISNINGEGFSEGIQIAINGFREDLKKQHPRKYEDI